MSIVGRKGKLRLLPNTTSGLDPAWQRIEDMLTADVFGAYRYLPVDIGIKPFLSHARDENEQYLFDYLQLREIDTAEINYARIIFWPHLIDNREPDLLIFLGKDQNRLFLAILCEAKLHSPQHVVEHKGITRSQLGHYSIFHLNGAYTDMPQIDDFPDVRIILYITSGGNLPSSELITARNEIIEYHTDLTPEDLGLFWCSWSHAGLEADLIWHDIRNEVDIKPWGRLLFDLYHDLQERDLLPRDPFRGVPEWDEIIFGWEYSHICKLSKPEFHLPNFLYSSREYETIGDTTGVDINLEILRAKGKGIYSERKYINSTIKVPNFLRPYIRES